MCDEAGGWRKLELTTSGDKVQFTLPAADLSACLLVERCEPIISLAEVTPTVPGERGVARVTVTNLEAKELTGQVTLQLPAGWRSEARPVKVGPGQSADVGMPFTVAPNESCDVHGIYAVVTDGSRVTKRCRPLGVCRPVQAEIWYVRGNRVRVEMGNSSTGAVSGSCELVTPNGVTASPATQPFTLPAGGTGELLFDLAGIEGVQTLQYLRARLKYGQDETPAFEHLQPVAAHPGVYMTGEAGPVAGAGLDLLDSPWGVDDLPACHSLADVAKVYQGYWLDAAGQRLYVRVAGGVSLSGRTVWVLRDGCGLAVTGEHVRIAGLTLRRFAGQGISVSAARDVIIERCTVSHCGAVWSAAVQLGKTTDASVADCVLYCVRNGVIAQDADGTRLTHNTIFHTRAHGVYLVSGSGTVLRDNILVAGGGSGSALYVGAPAATDLHSDHNCFLDSRTPTLICWMPLGLRFATFWDYQQTIAGQDEHSLSADPLFVSTTPGREDFHLRPESPCRLRASDGSDVGCRYP